MDALTTAARRPVDHSGVTRDEQVVAMWLDGRSPATRRAYGADVLAFMAHVGKPLQQVTLGDVQSFRGALSHLSLASQARKLGAVKSLLSFGHSLGFLLYNSGAPIRVTRGKSTLAERILSEASVVKMLALESDTRNHALLRLLYLCGLRISEAAALKRRDLQERGDAGQITVYGKGDRTRAILLTPSLWNELASVCSQADADSPLFRSTKGGHLDPSAVHRIVKLAATRAGLGNAVSAHWLRHAHVSHALDNGAPVHLVRATVGHADLATTGQYAHARPSDSSVRYLRA